MSNIPDNLKQWIVTNLERGCDPDALKEELRKLGHPESVINTEIKLAVHNLSKPKQVSAHKPIKVLDSKEGLVFDNFLSEEDYQKMYQFALRTSYEHINTKGAISRAWHIHDGFPLRSTLSAMYYADETARPDETYAYPTGTLFDTFIDKIIGMEPETKHICGEQKQDWWYLTATSWIYPHGTALSLHDDGAGVYSGAYVYFLNPVWRPHWGGQLLMVDTEANHRIKDYARTRDGRELYDTLWLHANKIDELVMEQGLGRCIFPKRNRIVFIANDAQHMVTRVNEQCGDNLRMSFAGFFNKAKK